MFSSPTNAKECKMGKPNYKAMADLYKKARDAGLAAGAAAKPVPMVVQAVDGFGPNARVIKTYEPVMDGVCVFAWIKMRPARGAFYDYCKANDLGRKDYDGGWSIWVGDFNQSMERKERYAGAFARVLEEAGIKAYSMSRMD